MRWRDHSLWLRAMMYVASLFEIKNAFLELMILTTLTVDCSLQVKARVFSKTLNGFKFILNFTISQFARFSLSGNEMKPFDGQERFLLWL